MNEFKFDTKSENLSNKKHFYIYVEYVDMENDRLYCYTSKDERIKKDETLMILHTSKKLDHLEEYLSAFQIEKNKKETPKLIYEVIS